MLCDLEKHRHVQVGRQGRGGGGQLMPAAVYKYMKELTDHNSLHQNTTHRLDWRNPS